MSLAEERETAKVLWYGDPGTSKTTDLVSLARLGKVFVVEAEAGLKARPLRDFGIPPENIEPYRQIDYTSLDSLFWEIKEELDDDPDFAVGVGFDSMTEVTQLLLGLIVDKEQGAKIAKAERRGEDADEIDPFFRDLSYWGTLTEQIRRLVRSYKTLPLHLGMTALVRRDLDEKTGKVMYGPAVSPAVQQDLMGAVDVIAYCRTEGYWPKGFEVGGKPDYDVMVADMRRTETHHAKDRFHATPRVLVNPTFERIIGYIDGSLTVEKDEQQQAYRELYLQRRNDAKAEREERRAKKTAAKQTTGSKPATATQTGSKPATGTKPAKKAAARPSLQDEGNDGDEGGDD